MIINISLNFLKFIDLTDKYLAELNEKDALTPETFLKLASTVPKEKRESFDNLMDVLLNLLKKSIFFFKTFL